MKKSTKKEGKPKKALKRYKEDLDNYLSNDDTYNALLVCDKIIKYFPKNVYGYDKKIELLTNSYTNYLNPDSLKNLKELNEVRLSLTTKKNYDNVKKDFDDYINDYNEVLSLEKEKKELVYNYLSKYMYENGITYLNNLINSLSGLRPDGKKILNFYDFIKGMFLFFCLVFNLIFKSYLLIFTIPFGIYGLIVIYNFIDTNISKYKIEKKDKEKYDDVMHIIDDKKNELKKELDNILKRVEFSISQKNIIITRIPSAFKDNLDYLYNDDESDIALDLFNKYTTNSKEEFKNDLKSNTNTCYEDFENSIINIIKFENEDVDYFINSKLDEKKNKTSKLLVMKPIKKTEIFIMVLLLLISVVSLITIILNFYDFNFKAFITSIIIGTCSSLIYNINRGKSSKLIDTFNDNLLSCIFNATLTYNLIYESITNNLSFTYNFIEIPIVLTLIFMGFVMLISYLKYSNLKRKLSK